MAAVRHRVPTTDLVLAAVLALFGELDVLLSHDWHGPVAVNAVVVPIMVLSLIWRRTRPLLCLSVVMGGLSLLSVIFGGSETWTNVFVTMVAVYSAAAHASNPLAVVGLAAVGSTALTLTDSNIHSFGEAVWTSTLFGLTFVAGFGGRSLHARRDDLDQRAEALDREEEERAAIAAGEERQRIARELHDIVAHSLGVLVLQAGAADQVLESDPDRAREVLRSIRATGLEAIDELGTLLGLVRGEAEPSRQPQPSLVELESLVENTRRAGLAVDLEIEGARRRLPAGIELSAFRVVQEGLTNALKHAGPAKARVVVRYRERELEVEVTDDGRQSHAGFGSRHGLAGLRERLAVFGGALEVGPRPGGGWRLWAQFPLAR